MPHTFVKDGPPPDDPVVIPLDALGITFLNSRAGTQIVLTGSMPTWSFDTRSDPFDPSKPFEKHELIFGLTDVHSGVPKPKLTIEFTPVPEPATLAALSIGMIALYRKGKKG